MPVSGTPSQPTSVGHNTTSRLPPANTTAGADHPQQETEKGTLRPPTAANQRVKTSPSAGSNLPVTWSLDYALGQSSNKSDVVAGSTHSAGGSSRGAASTGVQQQRLSMRSSVGSPTSTHTVQVAKPAGLSPTAGKARAAASAAPGASTTSNKQGVSTKASSVTTPGGLAAAGSGSTTRPPGGNSPGRPRTNSSHPGLSNDEESNRRETVSSGHQHVANPLYLREQTENNADERNITSESVRVSQLESAGAANGSGLAAEEIGEGEWLQIPELFYMFANLIELHQFQQQHKAIAAPGEVVARGGEETAAQFVLSERERKEQQRLIKRVSFSVFEVSGLLLNPWLATWKPQRIKNLVQGVAEAWKRQGPGSKEFEEASFPLLEAISSDERGRIKMTPLYKVWAFLGNMRFRLIVVGLILLMMLLSLACVVLLAVTGRDNLVLYIVWSAILGVLILVHSCTSWMLLDHNTYADATARFFREESLVTAEDAMDREDGVHTRGSFPEFGSDGSWALPYEEGGRPLDSDRRSGFGFPQVGDSNEFHQNTQRYPDEETDDRFISMISRSLQPADPAQKELLERDRTNALLTTRLNYEQHQKNVQQHQEQILREKMGGKGAPAAVAEAPKTEAEKQAGARGTTKSEAGALLVDGLTEHISITALVYCQDYSTVGRLARTLWEHNFLTLRRSSMSALDSAYHHGSEKFKVFLLHAPDFPEGSGHLQTALSWIREKRPVFFFSSNVSTFASTIPLATRMEIPLSEHDIKTLLLSGIRVDEELNKTTAYQPAPHFKVPAYTLGRRLGGGAFGNVFEAEMEDSGGKCAVKRMYLKTSNDDGEYGAEGPSNQLREIAQEVEIMSSLSHPNIVQYLFCERDDNCISIFMELCSGGSLSTRIADGSLLDAEQIKHLLTDIISAVSYLHNRRIVHRDLKPDNVLFRDGRAKVTDFGTAVLKAGDLRLIKGTFAYMAPEILVGEPYGKACDVWSIGCIASEVLCVDLPQRSLGLPEMSEFYRSMDLNSALDIQCDVPVIREFLLACLQRNPQRRQTADSLLHHDMLRADNPGIARWIETVLDKRRLATKSSNGHLVLRSGSRGEKRSNESSLQSSRVFMNNQTPSEL